MMCPCVCGNEKVTGSAFCRKHADQWINSPEQRRAKAILAETTEDRIVQRTEAALADFARRTEAEERNSK